RRVAQVQALGLAEAVADPGELIRRVREATAGGGADAVLVAAQSQTDAPLRQAVELARRRGRVVVVGDVPIHVDRAPFYAKELDLLISCSYGPGRHDPEYEEAGRDYPFAQVRWTARRNLSCFLDLAAANVLPLADLGLAEHALDDAPIAYAALVDTESRPLGALLRCPAADGQASMSPPATATEPAAHTLPVGLALVGAGAFARGMLLPQLRQHDGLVRWQAVVSVRGVEARNLAITERIPSCYADLGAALADSAVRGLVIATRHQHHAEQISAGLAAGRTVFCEKPLCISWNELADLERAATAASGKPRLLVGFNRRFAPAAVALQRGLAKRKGPALIHYTVNAGHLPPTHWLHQENSGGRNLGEACHVYDLLGFLVGAPPAQISAQAIVPRAGHARADENFTASLRFVDGSVATLLYSSLGDPAAGKERVEIYVDGCTWVLDDWRSLVRWAGGRAETMWSHVGDGPVDKGHGREMELAAAFLAGQTTSPIAWEELRQTSAIALWVQDCLEGRLATAVLGSEHTGGPPCAA
ncbi:MAG: Gfo/Idh/MocA family oxidoreductase, partial [Planctomycetota bacterium]